MINGPGKQAINKTAPGVTILLPPPPCQALPEIAAVKARAEQINALDGIAIYGRVVGVRGLTVEVAGPRHAMSVGARVVIETPGEIIPCAVVGFSGVNALLYRSRRYRAGTSPEVDETIGLHKPLEEFLAQGKDEAPSLAEGYLRLAEIVAASETDR